MKHFFPLEDFGAPAKRAQPRQNIPPKPAPVKGPSPAEIETNRMAAYEQGYKAGWDDVVQSQTDDQSRIGADFARNLQDLGFTFHEAKSHVMKSLEPLLSEVISKVLPKLASETLGQMILEELLPFADEVSDAPIQIVVAPSGRAAIEALVDTSLTIPLEVLEEPSLADGQVYLRMGDLEKKIDMDNAIERIGDAIKSIYKVNEEAMKHG
jgi:flagellar assembly protein FliH